MSMSDTIISFQTAKLAKEKGFNIPCYSAYSIWRGNIRKSQTEEQALKVMEIEYEPYMGGLSATITKFYQSNNYTLAPTQALLHRWLREIHNIDVVIAPERYKDGVNYVVQAQKFDLTSDPETNINFCVKGSYWFNDNHDYPTYEDAMEKGLQEGLKLIK